MSVDYFNLIDNPLATLFPEMKEELQFGMSVELPPCNGIFSRLKCTTDQTNRLQTG
jgi:hypothetical protein